MVVSVRPSAIAGSWYPADPEKLRAQVDDFLAAADLPEVDGQVVGLVVPHAGLRYSGQTAGYGFGCVRGYQPEIVAVLSPFHRYPDGEIFVSRFDAYETPLGQIAVDRQVVDALGQQVALTSVGYEQEHAVEIELPFLQRVLAADFKLLPLMLAPTDPDTVYQLGQALAAVLRGREALLVASSDLSHFKPVERASLLDGEIMKEIAAFCPEGLLAAQQTGRGYACGLTAILAVMVAARLLGADRAQVLHYSTSADASKDTSSVVGYGAAAFVRSEG